MTPAPFPYELPSAAGGREGIEGFAVETGDGPAGYLAALNRTPEGLVLVVDDGQVFRAVPARHAAEINLVDEVVRLTPEGEAAFAAAPVVEPVHTGPDPAHLIRHIPAELDRIVTTEGTARPHSALWLAGGLALVFAGVAILPAHLLMENEVGGPLRFAWMLLPVVFLTVAVWLLFAAADADGKRKLTLREKLDDAPAFLLGVSPRTRTRR
jgi:hypothetical protein